MLLLGSCLPHRFGNLRAHGRTASEKRRSTQKRQHRVKSRLSEFAKSSFVIVLLTQNPCSLSEHSGLSSDFNFYYFSDSYASAMHSISQSAPLGICFTATQLLAGLDVKAQETVTVRPNPYNPANFSYMDEISENIGYFDENYESLQG